MAVLAEEREIPNGAGSLVAGRGRNQSALRMVPSTKAINTRTMVRLWADSRVGSKPGRGGGAMRDDFTAGTLPKVTADAK